MVRRLELEDHVFFVPSQASLGLLFEMADVFYLPSRLDPFPNVVLDAFKAGKAVVCFDRATGVADAIREGPVRGAAVPYCDVHEAAKALSQFMEPAERTAAAANARFAQTHFDFDDYVNFIAEQIELAKSAHADVVASLARIDASGTFDAGFHDGTGAGLSVTAKRRSILDYAARGTKGLYLYNPRPGFSDGLFRSLHPPENAYERAPLERSIAEESPETPSTHRCETLSDREPPGPFDGRVALHVHLHYPELASEYMERLASAKCRADLFVTTTSPEKRIEVQYAFRKYKLGSVEVVEVPNRGRDIGPLLTSAAAQIRNGNYDVVGHFHGKRSLAVERALGDRWRSYLANTLIGDGDHLRRLLALFGTEPQLGLVFAEDRHGMGWTKNAPFAHRLARQLRPQPAVPRFPVFPLGTMFWARPAVLEPLWRLDLDASDLPGEPLPYDGSMLHAIERMLPSICEAAGYSWCTVYRPGAAW
jgi:hypothetical protein